MAISYATSGFTFVDSQFGSASATNIKSLVNVAIDRRYHKEVQKKLFWQRLGLIGEDSYSEGNGVVSAPGLPVIRKTDLTRNPGDTIIMGLRKNLAFTVNTGKVHDTQLVDAEVAFDFNNLKVKIDLWRQGVRTNAGLNRQRNPYESFEEIEMSLLSDWSAQMLDTSIFYALHYGYAPHTFREHGHTNAAPAAKANTLFGNDTTLSTSRTIADIQGTNVDDLNAKTLELGALYMEQNDFDPVMVNGEPWWVAIVSPRGRYYLLKDDRLRNAMKDARERGTSNPLFRHAELTYNNVMVFTADKIRSIIGGYNPAGLTVGGEAITEAAYTGIGGGVASTDLHQTQFLGANALAIAEGQFGMADRVRKEDDYEMIVGRAVENTFGVKRAEWPDEAGANTINQASLTIVNTLVAS